MFSIKISLKNGNPFQDYPYNGGIVMTAFYDLYRISLIRMAVKSNWKTPSIIAYSLFKSYTSSLSYKEGYYVEHTTGPVKKFTERKGISGGRNFEEFKKYFNDSSNKYILQEIDIVNEKLLSIKEH